MVTERHKRLQTAALRVASDMHYNREDRMQKFHELAGMAAECVYYLSGGLDDLAAEVLGFDNGKDKPAPLEPYTAEEVFDDTPGEGQN